MDLMNSRFRQFGASFGSKRTSNRNGQNSQNTLPPTANGVNNHTPAASTSSTTSLPMNPPQNGLGRPPSYTYNPHAQRSASPMPPVNQQTMSHHPHRSIQAHIPEDTPPWEVRLNLRDMEARMRSPTGYTMHRNRR